MLKKVAIIIVALIIILLAAAAVLPKFFKKEIETKIKSAINGNLNAKVAFKDIDLSLITSFPNLGIEINSLTIIGVDSFAKDTLANVNQLKLNVNLLSVISGDKYEIKSVYLNQPKIFAQVLKSGKASWDIMKVDSAKIKTDTSKRVSRLLYKNTLLKMVR